MAKVAKRRVFSILFPHFPSAKTRCVGCGVYLSASLSPHHSEKEGGGGCGNGGRGKKTQMDWRTYFLLLPLPFLPSPPHFGTKPLTRPGCVLYYLRCGGGRNSRSIYCSYCVSLQDAKHLLASCDLLRDLCPRRYGLIYDFVNSAPDVSTARRNWDDRKRKREKTFILPLLPFLPPPPVTNALSFFSI